MSDLARDTTYTTSASRQTDAFLVKDDVVLFAGCLVGIDTNGFLDHWGDDAGMKFAGMCLEGCTGDGTSVYARVDTSGKTVHDVTLASSVQGSVNALVYCASSNIADAVLTGTTNVGPIGWYKRHKSAGVGRIELFTPAHYQQNVGLGAITPFTDNTTGTESDTLAAGVGIETIIHPLTSLATGLSTSAIDLMTARVVGYKFKILSWGFCTTVAGTGAGASQTFNLEIGTTDLTGGSLNVTLASTSDIGELTNATAITAANTGTAADTISIEMAASGTVFTAGAGYFFIRIQNMDTADAIASLAAKDAEFINA